MVINHIVKSDFNSYIHIYSISYLHTASPIILYILYDLDQVYDNITLLCCQYYYNIILIIIVL